MNAIFIGRFQPFHTAHLEIALNAFAKYEQVIFVLGSSNQARNIKNPFTPSEREKMIALSVGSDNYGRSRFITSKDYYYSFDLWKRGITEQVNEPVTLIGTKSDSTSWYLDSFPEWKVDLSTRVYPTHATNIREFYLRGGDQWKHFVAPLVQKYLIEFKSTDAYKSLCVEQNFVDDYIAKWKSAPYPPQFITVDAVVVKSGHVLVTRRKGQPGKGLFALPGGFLSDHETLEEGVVRELKEETGIKLSKEMLVRSIRSTRPFDYPYRSVRGRTLTHGFYFNLGYSGELPQVRGGDDAADAMWMPLNQVEMRENEFFEDHAEIIRAMVS